MKTRTIIDARQSNHSSFFVPKELAGTQERSLYKNIAKWSLITKKYICCDDVSEQFGISKRQATNVISIIHRLYSDMIICKIKRKRGEGSTIKTYLLVTEINERKRKPRINKKPTNKDVFGEVKRVLSKY